MKRRSKITLVVALVLLLATTAFVIGVSASDNTPSLSVTGANVSFQETVHLWYAVGHENISNPDAIKLLVWREGSISHISECVLGSQNYTLNVVGEVNEGKVQGKTFEFAGLAASEMTENVYARAYVEEDGEIIYSPVVKYSILQYALNMLGVTAGGSSDQYLKNMLSEMLKYGAAAQLYFDHDTTAPLATDDFVKITLEDATLTDGTKSGIFKVGTEVKLIASPTAENPYVLWTDANGKLLSAKESYTVIAKQNTTFKATLSSVASSFGMYDRVVIVGIDGAGGTLFQNANMTNCNAIFANGATTYNMLTNPSVSAHSWASILHGVETEDHGVLENWQVETLPFDPVSKYPSILRVIKEATPDVNVASIASWGGINTGIVEDGYGIYKYKNGDANGTNETVRYINETDDFKLLYVHLNDPDAAGHGSGYGGTEYNTVMQRTDENIGKIYQALVDSGKLEGTLFIVTTDHGGVDKGHGGMSAQEQRVFFGAVGSTVPAGGTILDMENRDCAAIALYALGYEQPETYTSRVPTGIFEGVTATARPTYYDADNPRDILVSGQTPAYGSDNYITNFVNNGLISYIPFDGSEADEYGNITSSRGTVSYTDGYFGQSVNLNEGNIVLENINPGYGSFTMALWVKVPCAYRKSPIVSTKAWNGAAVQSQGFLLALDGDAGHSIAGYEGGMPGVFFNASDGTAYDTLTAPVPLDYHRGWTHIIAVVDREANELRVSFDFGEPVVLELPAEFTGSMTSTQYKLCIGDDTQGKANYKMGLTVDEFMIFDGALGANDINGLAEYYNKDAKLEQIPETEGNRDHVNIATPVVGSGSHLSDYDSDLFASLEYYLPFDKNNNNLAPNDNKVIEVGSVTYTSDGYFGEGLRLRTTSDYLQLPDLSIGKNSFSVGFWMNVNELSGSTIPILSSQNLKTSSASKGFTLFASNKECLNFYLADGSNRFNLTNTDAAFPTDYKDGWVYVIFVLDRDNKVWKISYDFGEFATGSIAGYDFTAEGAEGSVWTIGQDGFGGYWTALRPVIDEMMIFGKALSPSDLNTLNDYYQQKKILKTPTKDSEGYITNYVDDIPSLYIPFDNSTVDLSYGSTLNVVGDPTYVKAGYFSSAASFASDKYVVKAPDIKLDKGSFTIAFWMDVNSLVGSTIPIVSTQHGEGGVSLGGTQGFTLSTGTNASFGKYIEFYLGTGSSDVKVVNKLPDNVEDLGWIHVTAVVDRALGTYTLYLNFAEATDPVYNSITTAGINKNWTADGGKADSVFTIGESGSGAYWNNLNAQLDDFLLFNSALTADEVLALQSYYTGGEGTVDKKDTPDNGVENFVDNKLNYYLNFDGNTENLGESETTVTTQNIGYQDGIYGQAAQFNNKGYVRLNDAKLDPEANGATGNYTIAFWMNASKPNGDHPIIATSDWDSSNNPGLALFLLSSNNFRFNLADGTDRLAQNKPLPDGYVGEWVHIIVSVDRAARKVYVYFNFELAATYDIPAGLDGEKSDAGPLTIGHDGSDDNTRRLPAALDELMIFDGAFDSADVAALQSYFEQ